VVIQVGLHPWVQAVHARWTLLNKAVAMAVGIGLLCLWLPTLWRLMRWVWPGDEQSQGPLVLLVSAALIWHKWPLWQKRTQLRPAPSPTPSFYTHAAWTLFVANLILYALGRSQAILLLEVGALIGVLVALLALFGGWKSLKVLAFPLCFLIFAIPLPEAVVASVTGPLKAAVSWVATQALHTLGLPVGRSGVMMTAGPYQLLVADACAGLNTLFTLEALGLLYMHMVGHVKVWRNTLLALLLVPIAFAANVLRVMALVWVTLFWGDAAGQGLAHSMAGFLFFGLGLMLMLLTDGAMGLVAQAGSAMRARLAL
jgi:exosortase B